MRCVQPDSHKRSVARDMGRSEEFMVPEKQEEEEITPRTPKQLPVDDYVSNVCMLCYLPNLPISLFV